MPRPKRSSASFNDRLLAALEAGCKREVKIPCAFPREAIRLRQEINKLRAALREEGRSDWKNYMAAGIYIDAKEPSVVIIRPKSQEFKAALDAAGIPDLNAPPPQPTTPPTTEFTIDSLLGDLRKYEPKE